MKKIISCFFIFNMIFIMGCQKKVIIDDKAIINEDKYTVEEAIENGDIVNVHGDITNYKKLEEFILNINNKIEDEIRIVEYTIEGDPIIMELKYHSKDLIYKYDNTRDKFGSPTLIEEKYRPEDFYENIFGYFITTEEQDIFIFERQFEDESLVNIKEKEKELYKGLEKRKIINDSEGYGGIYCWIYDPIPKNLIPDSNAVVKMKIKSEEYPVFFNELDGRTPLTPYNVEITEVLSGDLSLGDFKIYNTGGIVKLSDYIKQISEEEAKIKGYLDLENKEEDFLKFDEEHFYRLREGNEYLVILNKQDNGIYTPSANGYSIFFANNTLVDINEIDYENVISADTFKIDAFKKNDENTFIGVISEINESKALVDIESGSILSSGDKTFIDLSKGTEELKVGDRVKVKHTGLIRESYPMQIDTISVTKEI